MRLYFLPAHIYTCAVQDQAFFLDLGRDRYLSAPLGELRGIGRFVEGWPSGLDGVDAPGEAVRAEGDVRATVEDLVAAHLLYPLTKPLQADIARTGMGSCAHIGCTAQAALLEDGVGLLPGISGGELLAFLKAAVGVRARLRVCSLYSIIRRIERRRGRHSVKSASLDLGELRHLVAVFRRLSPWLPPSRVPCLLRSLTLIELLAAYRHFPRLVFGVQAHPFSAHCWVQHDATVLNSTLEDVVNFTPILSV